MCVCVCARAGARVGVGGWIVFVSLLFVCLFVVCMTVLLSLFCFDLSKEPSSIRGIPHVDLLLTLFLVDYF